MQALLRLRGRDAETTSYVADYLTRSVRRASGFVLANQPPITETPYETRLKLDPGFVVKTVLKIASIEC